jgi:uridine monophosphate synthetase
VIFDDLITSGASIEEGVNILVPAGLNVKDVVLAMDREQGGRERLEKEGLNVRAAFTMTQMLNFYARVERLSDGALQDIKQRLNILNTFIEV